MLYLVIGIVEERGYMSDNNEAIRRTHLVDANSESEAGQKFEEHYRKMTDEYAVYYSVNSVVVSETII